MWMVLAFTVIFHTPTLDLVRSPGGFWALDNLHAEPGTEQLMVGIVLPKGYCLHLDGRGVVGVEVRNKRTGDTKWVRDCGVKVREGYTLHGWKDTLVEDAPIVIRWDDDGQMRTRYERTRPDVRVVPTRMLIYLPAAEVLGQRHNWEVVNVSFVRKAWEVKRCD